MSAAALIILLLKEMCSWSKTQTEQKFVKGLGKTAHSQSEKEKNKTKRVADLAAL